MKQYFDVIVRLSKTLNKAFVRDKTALFFTFVFPIIFLLIFGSLNKTDKGVSFDIAVVNQSQTQFSKEFYDNLKTQDFVKEKSVSSLDNAKEKMSRGEVDTILVMPENFGNLNAKNQPTGSVIVYFNPSNPQTGQTFATIMDSVLGGINEKLTNQEPLFIVEQQSTDTRGLSSFDYVFAGLLGFSILSLGFFGPTNSLPTMKKAGILRRLRTTPIRTSQFVLGNALNYLYIGLSTIALMFIAGVIVFGFQMQGDYISLAIIAAFGTFMMYGFGLAIGGWAKNPDQAAPLTNLIAFPMMFLSGVFFPRFLMPEWLQTVSSLIPLSPLVDGIRYIIVEGRTIFEIGPQLAVMGIWTIVIYFIAFKLFRWE